jgi:hypothetical protein
MKNFILGAAAAFAIMLVTGTTPQQVLTKFEAWCKVMWQQRST